MDWLTANAFREGAISLGTEVAGRAPMEAGIAEAGVMEEAGAAVGGAVGELETAATGVFAAALLSLAFTGPESWVRAGTTTLRWAASSSCWREMVGMGPGLGWGGAAPMGRSILDRPRVCRITGTGAGAGAAGPEGFTETVPDEATEAGGVEAILTAGPGGVAIATAASCDVTAAIFSGLFSGLSVFSPGSFS